MQRSEAHGWRVPVPFKDELKEAAPLVIRGGIGLFNGRYLLVPAFTELQQNGVNGGRILRTRVNGALLGLNFPPFILDPNNPTNTGVLLNPDITLLGPDLETPESTQASLGWTHSFTPRLFFDAEGVWAEGSSRSSSTT